jgi:hypothetical protein
MKMKAKLTDENEGKAGAGNTFRNACQASCQKILAQIKEAKAAVLAESCGVLEVPEQLLKLALNEAEALAWQTLYPQLLFPALAAEKIQAVAGWNQHQQSVRRANPVISF